MKIDFNAANYNNYLTNCDVSQTPTPQQQLSIAAPQTPQMLISEQSSPKPSSYSLA